MPSVERPVRDHPDAAAAYGSDLAVDVLRLLGYDYLPLCPGSSIRGLHDSVVNHAGNRQPQLILCLHEEIAVAVAHGYAKASGRPAAAAVHDLVGLMHASMAVYNASCDQVPLLLIGGSGPADPGARRPIDWTHSANTQAQLVRDYVKWDAEAVTPASFESALTRAHTIAMSPPEGPTYVSLDAAAQEQRLTASASCHRADQIPPRLMPDPNVIERAAALLADANRPLVVGGLVGRRPRGTQALVMLVDQLGASYQDERNLVAFPTDHPHNCTGDVGLLADADVVLAVEPANLFAMTAGVGARTVIEISYADIAPRSWSNHGAAPRAAHLSIAGDPVESLRLLTEELDRRMPDDRRVASAAVARRRSAAQRDRQRRAVQVRWSQRPVSPARLVAELWESVRDVDWQLALRNTRSWPEGIWRFRGGGDYLGHSGGGGVGYGPGAIVGAALAARRTGRLVVAIVGDGDLLMAAGALWTATHYRLPMLVVVNDNQSMYNDEAHQRDVARHRGRPEENSGIAVRVEDPAVAIADLARSYGCWAIGPIDDPDELRPALLAAKHEALHGATAVVHVLTSPS
jgi:acetolactate synthase-1/2/3 large subunit